MELESKANRPLVTARPPARERHVQSFEMAMGNGRLLARAGSAWLLVLLCCWWVPGSCVARPARGSGLEASAQPQPCQAPQQWEGRAVVYDHTTGKNSRVLISYDGQNQRVRILDEKKGHIPCKK